MRFHPYFLRWFSLLLGLCLVGAVFAPAVEATAPQGSKRLGSKKSPFYESPVEWEVYYDAILESPLTLDPAAHNNSSGDHVIEQVYETLVTYNGREPTTLVPQLAMEMPTVSDDGLTYTFTIRDNITFHAGGTLTAADVAYSFQRGILQGGYDAPYALLSEPILGAGIRDVSEWVVPAGTIPTDPDATRQAVLTAPPETLLSICTQVQQRIRAEGNQVVFTLPERWAPFLVALATPRAGIVDQEWVTAQGGWDGDCNTWHYFYDFPPEKNPLTQQMNGTGPFQLERFREGEEIRLVANEAYWRTREVGPAWENGPVGQPALEKISISIMPEWHDRFVGMLAAELDSTAVELQHFKEFKPYAGVVCDYQLPTQRYRCAQGESEYAPLRLYRGPLVPSRTKILFNWNINTASTAPWLGSGTFDGKGIPPTFFSDVHVRRAFAYCFNQNIYIEDLFGGHAIPGTGLLPPSEWEVGIPSTIPSYDLAQCEAELEQAWGGVLPTSGFWLQVPYRTNDDTTYLALTLLQKAFSEINPLYELEVVGLPAERYEQERTENRLPLIPLEWEAEGNDPHYWVTPFLVAPYPQLANIPAEVIRPFASEVEAAPSTLEEATRHEQYRSLQQQEAEQVFALHLPVPWQHHYEQRWVLSPKYPTRYYYALRKGIPPTTIFHFLVPDRLMEYILERQSPIFL